MKLLSVCIPCYNSSAYMEKCVRSLAVAGDEIELLIIDDGSSDNTLEIGQQLAKEFPNSVCVIHQENKGHGGAVNTALEHASAPYFKVVDSDDWVDSAALTEIMNQIRVFVTEECKVDLLISNYVNEIQGRRAKVMDYCKIFPENKPFTWDEVNPFPAGKYLMMHALIYRTEILKEVNLILPEHTFYVDNLYVYKPLQNVQKMYYVNLDFYRYLIGRNDQSVNEKMMIKRIDQQLKVNYLLIDSVDFSNEMHPAVRQYLWQHLEIVMGISSAILNKMGGDLNIQKRIALWQYLKEKSPTIYYEIRQSFFGRMVNPVTKSGLWASNQVYKIIRRLAGF